jgi:hypothetical protein
MSDVQGVGRVLIAVGALLLIAGLIVTFAGRLPFIGALGRLPGDVVWRRGSTTVYLPIVTSLVLSLLLSLVLAIIFRR